LCRACGNVARHKGSCGDKDGQHNNRLAEAPGKLVASRQRLVGPFPPHSGRPRTHRPGQRSIYPVAARMPIAAAARIRGEGVVQASAADRTGASADPGSDSQRDLGVTVACMLFPGTLDEHLSHRSTQAARQRGGGLRLDGDRRPAGAKALLQAGAHAQADPAPARAGEPGRPAGAGAVRWPQRIPNDTLSGGTGLFTPLDKTQTLRPAPQASCGHHQPPS